MARTTTELEVQVSISGPDLSRVMDALKGTDWEDTDLTAANLIVEMADEVKRQDQYIEYLNDVLRRAGVEWNADGVLL